MIDPTTGWSEIVQYNDKHADTTSNLVQKGYLCIYLRPTIITYDHGNELLGHSFKNYLNEKNAGLSLSVKPRKIYKQNSYENEFTKS